MKYIFAFLLLTSSSSAIGLEKHHHHHKDKAGDSEKVDVFREYSDDYDTPGFHHKHSAYPFIPSVNGQDFAPNGHSNGYTASQNNLKVKKRDDYDGYDYHNHLDFEYDLGSASARALKDHHGNKALSNHDTEPNSHPNGATNW